ncbi:MAG: rhomboid family intramembrane serine protease, partial [Pseudobacter sp.]|uniref:rhomboid family intramembrane serine protease n=1 Tax=Pseudobacter sp. TaxID=2045420 RepID=UPI003F7E54DF
SIIMSKLDNDTISMAEAQGRAYRIMLTGTLGASGAIMGVMAAFTYLNPNQEMMLFPLPIPIKMKYLMVAYVLLDLFGGINPGGGDGIAHFAHLGGALFGFLLVAIMNRNNRRTYY